ncbi:dethiobiotin synthase [Fusobacterium sp. PH5-44]|uniref:dethiobiotin synthase n=1 Tax=unclassified Fusobacterium TaxID=2648384 RepID=UPI003D1A5EB4
MAKKLFITGTGTDVGKTYITALIIKKLKENNYNTGYYKAAASGNKTYNNGILYSEDSEYIKKIAQLDEKSINMVSYIYEKPLSPHLAGILEKNPACIEKIKKDVHYNLKKYDYLTIEGSGGIICPIRYDKKEQIFLEDIIKLFNIPCIIVANTGLGTINNTLLTISYMKSKNIKIQGIIFNKYNPNNIMETDNIKMIQNISGIKILDCIKIEENNMNINASELAKLYE